MFIKCGCLNCGQNIEFSTDDFQEDHRTASAIFGQLVPCPGCSNETRIFIPQVPPKQPAPEETWKRYIKPALIAAGYVLIPTLVLVALYFLMKKYGDVLGEAVGGGIMVVIYAAGVFLAVFWIIFPVLMYSQLKRTNQLLEMVERNTRPPAAHKKDSSAKG